MIIIKANRFLKAIFFILLFQITYQMFSQQMRFTYITSGMGNKAGEGLSMGNVNCVIQDSLGFMWFGTQDGLNRYDGYNKITVFKHNPDDSTSLSSSFIYALYEGKNNVLYIGTYGGGLDEYNLITRKYTHHTSIQGNTNSLSNNNVRAIIEDKNGLIWVGTEEGLNSYDRKTKIFKRYLIDEKKTKWISDNAILCLHEGGDGRLWIGTYGGGLMSFDKITSKFKRYLQVNSFGHSKVDTIKTIRSIFEDKDGIFWIGTSGQGIEIFNPQLNTFTKNIRFSTNDSKTKSLDIVSSITADDKGIIWIGTSGGICMYDWKTGKSKYLVSTEKQNSGININQIKCIYKDRGGSIWIGTEGGGVNVHLKAYDKFKFYSGDDFGIKSNEILTLMEDKDNLLWVGTMNGGLTVVNLETNDLVQYKQLSTISNNSILNIFQAKDGIIWIGTWGHGVYTYDKKTKKVNSFSQFNTETASTIICIYEDSYGKIWIGTYGGGVFVYDKLSKVFIHLTTKDGLGSDNIYNIFEDSKNNMWISTDGGGVNKYSCSKNKFKIYLHNDKINSITSNTVNCVYEDNKNNIWFGTANGLNKFNIKTEHFEHWYEKDGLPNDFIYCMLPDSQGNIWMTTNKGVSRFNPNISNENGAAFQNYDLLDGLQGLEFNQGAYYKNKVGEMFLGGVHGFNKIYPEKSIDNNIPPIRILSFKRFGKEIDFDTAIYYKKRIELSWRDNFFSFDFGLLDYLKSEKNKYSYKLEGFDADWSPLSSQGYANYTGLSGGDYVFKVRGINNDGVWNNDGAKIFIHIIPPFWQTWWFRTLVGFFVIACVVVFFRLRTANLRKRQKELEQTVTERTEELVQKNIVVENQKHLVEEKNREITDSIEYALRIQTAILPPQKVVKQYLENSFVLYKPKDIVAGDFYWMETVNDWVLFAACDCTGHGVPGAMVSVVCHNSLNRAVREFCLTQPAAILDKTAEIVIENFSKSEEDIKDGMDISLCSYNTKTKILQWAGANNPLWLMQNGELVETKADKQPIGMYEDNHPFTNHEFQLKMSDSIYIFSDGFADQFGGDTGAKKLTRKRFKELLFSIQSKSMQDQGIALEKFIIDYRKNIEQIDDILVMGVRV